MKQAIEALYAQYQRANWQAVQSDNPEALAFWRKVRDQNAEVLQRCGVELRNGDNA